MVGLLTKACKTFRSIQVLCERGLYDDASALVRVLLETAVAVNFILRRNSLERARIYHAHGLVQAQKMLNEWKTTPGLKRKATKTIMKQTADMIAEYMKNLPPGTDVKRHWSGKGSLQEAMREMRGEVVYASVYRHTSAIVHAADFGVQFNVDSASGDLIWQVGPRVEGFEAPSYTARQLLWNMASYIDARLGLGFSATLAPHKLTSADVLQGKI